MPFIAKDERELPDDGEPVPAICCDLIDLGFRTNKWGKNEQNLKLLFLIGGRPMKDGRPFGVGHFLVNKLGPDTTPRKFLVAWKGGKDFTAEEAMRGIDLEKFCLGRKALVTIANEENTKGQVWPKIVNISPLPKEMEAGCPAIGAYVRMQDRPEAQQERQMAREAKQMFNGQETPF